MMYKMVKINDIWGVKKQDEEGEIENIRPIADEEVQKELVELIREENVKSIKTSWLINVHPSPMKSRRIIWIRFKPLETNLILNINN